MSEATPNQAIIANLIEAIHVIEETPEENINLARFRNECGTIFCTAGRLASTKYFQDLGMVLIQPYPNGNYLLCNANDLRHENGNLKTFEWGFLDVIFGKSAFDRLFSECGDGVWDHSLTSSDPGWNDYNDDGSMVLVLYNTTDKQLALLRLNRQLEIYQSL